MASDVIIIPEAAQKDSKQPGVEKEIHYPQTPLRRIRFYLQRDEFDEMIDTMQLGSSVRNEDIEKILQPKTSGVKAGGIANIFPPKFRIKELETAYGSVVFQLLPFRCLIISIALIAHIILLGIMTAEESATRTGSSSWNVILFAVIMVLSILILVLVSVVSSLRKYCERMVVVTCSSVILVMVAFTLSDFFRFYPHFPVGHEIIVDRTVVVVQLLASLSTSRLMYSVWVHVIALASWITYELLGRNFVDQKHCQLGTRINFMMAWSELLVIIMIFLANFFSESSHRKAFISWYRTKGKLRAIEDTIAQSSGTGKTPADRLIQKLRKIESTAQGITYVCVNLEKRGSSFQHLLRRKTSRAPDATLSVANTPGLVEDVTKYVNEIIELQKDCLQIITSTPYNLHEININDVQRQILRNSITSKEDTFSATALGAYCDAPNDSTGLKRYRTIKTSVKPVLHEIFNIKNTKPSDRPILVMTKEMGDLSDEEVSSLVTSLKAKCGQQWNFDIIGLSKHESFKGNVLMEVGMHLLLPCINNDMQNKDSLARDDTAQNINEHTVVSTEICCSIATLQKFMAVLQDGYNDNHYHNQIHGAEVAHLTACMALMQGIRTQNSQNMKWGILWNSASMSSPVTNSHLAGLKAEFVLILSALAHDVGHPGKNNSFLMNCSESLSIVYNDLSILESFHACRLFQLMQLPGCEILQGLENDEYRAARKQIIELILATDMSKHFTDVSVLRSRLQSPEFDVLNQPSDAWLLLKFCLKFADIGHSVLEWRQHKEWSLLVVQEFQEQGDEEIARGLPRSPLCDRQPFYLIAKSQLGFLKFIFEPLMLEMESACPNTSVTEICKGNYIVNEENWQRIAESGKTSP